MADITRLLRVLGCKLLWPISKLISQQRRQPRVDALREFATTPTTIRQPRTQTGLSLTTMDGGSGNGLSAMSLGGSRVSLSSTSTPSTVMVLLICICTSFFSLQNEAGDPGNGSKIVSKFVTEASNLRQCDHAFPRTNGSQSNYDPSVDSNNLKHQGWNLKVSGDSVDDQALRY